MTSSPKVSPEWFVLHTKIRAEKKLANQLCEDGIEAYCPTQIVVKQWSDRKKKVEIPLLPSMILVNISDQDRQKVFRRTNALRYMYWLGKPAIVTSEEIESLRSMVNNSKFETHGLEQLKPGERLDMTSLGFKQIQGTVKFVNNQECWIILEKLGYIVKFKKS